MGNEVDGEPSVRAVMRSDVRSAQVDDAVIDVASALVASGASGAPVLDGDGALAGVVSEYDVLGKQGATAADVMSRGVISIGPDATAAEAARLMGLHGIHMLPVVADARLVGVVNRADLLRVYTETLWRCGSCGEHVFGLARPAVCLACGGGSFRRGEEG